MSSDARRHLVLVVLLALAPLAVAAPATAAGRPDLVVKAMSAPASVAAGQAVAVSTIVANKRGSRARYSYVRVVLSRDRAAGSGDRVLGSRRVPALAVGATSTGRATYTVPASTEGGTWYLVACADATRRVREYRERNNCRASAMSVITNRAPDAADDALVTTEDTPVAVSANTLLANDTDPDDNPRTLTAVTPGSGGTVSLVSGTVTFTPTADFNGVATFGYTVSDGSLTDSAQVTVTVTPVNDPPVAIDDEATTSQDQQLVIDASALLANDVDVDLEALAVYSLDNAMNGSVLLSGTIITFTPESGFVGDAFFDYTVSDGTFTDVASVHVAVTAGPP